MFTYRPYGSGADRAERGRGGRPSAVDQTHPFTIGLNNLDLSDWIEPAECFADQMAEKDRLFASRPEEVFQAREDTLRAQTEVLDLLWDYLPQRYPDLYQVQGAGDGRTISGGGKIHLLATNRHYQRDEWANAPLALASRLVPDDLILMRDSPNGYYLAAAALCFPSSWSLAEKFNRPMDEIHRRVPEYAEALGPRLERIFANLLVEKPVWRLNWSLYGSPDLFQWSAESNDHHRFEPAGAAYGDSAEQNDQEPTNLAHCYLRVERQTLRRLPKSRDILFTIRIYHDPLAALTTHKDGAAIAAGLGDQLASLNEAQLHYKGLTRHRAGLLACLARIATRE